MSRHKIDVTDADPAQLAAELSAALQQDVAVSLRLPQEVDGEQIEGALVITDALTGEEVDEVDEKLVAKVLAAHTPPPAPPSRDEVLAAAEAKAADGDTAGALADVLALLRSQPA